MDYLYYNAAAGADDDVEFWFELLKGHGIEPSRPALGDREAVAQLDENDRLLIVGGDGTINYLAEVCAKAGCTVGVLPGGTANDFARGLNIGVDLDAACAVLQEGRVSRVDLAFVNEQPFVNVAHVGIGAGISDSLEEGKKSFFGRFSYLAKLIETIQARKGFSAEIYAGEATESGRWLEIVVANGNSFGGGHPVLGADPCDGKLDVVGLRPRSVNALLYEWVRVHVMKRDPHPDIVVQLSHDAVEIKTSSQHSVSADGEDAGATPASFRVEHQALSILVPKLD
ncbi:YegS/Rv2252/BmrU family lipid kinase [Congregibacter brevis]|uniref:YegS/Rv2252/BmrU family lipid kinase n=1 Tax=Congregibacter brevis TaxID=3081201 RepID=A0ABZ0I9P0_9GAMM|nr:YegS/Rv2252/BmrU family lipid kinase [Congregibacter sp. IMCC45268]